MSIYAFDLDGTLDVPAIARLARDLYAAGHKIHVVTGWLDPICKDIELVRQSKTQKLEALGVPYHEMHLVRAPVRDFSIVAKAKAEILKKIEAGLFIDDMIEFAQASFSVGVSSLCVYPPTRSLPYYCPHCSKAS